MKKEFINNKKCKKFKPVQMLMPCNLKFIMYIFEYQINFKKCITMKNKQI